jgi:hypothetical protein
MGKRKSVDLFSDFNGRLTATQAIWVWVAMGILIVGYGICAVVGFFTILGWLR